MSQLKTVGKYLSAMLATIILAQPSMAQSEAEQGRAIDAEPICMASPSGGVASKDAMKTARSSVIVVVRASVPDLEARGFKQTNCAQSGLKTPTDLGDYRDQVCNLAAYGNEAVQAQIYETLGEYPAVLCACAEKVSGAWDRRSKDGQK